MAQLWLSMLGYVLLLSVPACLSAYKGEVLTPPEKVKFELGFFQHILKWTHNKSIGGNILYDVQYTSYGANWTSVPHCTYTSLQHCDLTVETLPPSFGYIARVRSVLGKQTSKWARSSRYVLSQVILPPPLVSLDVDGPSVLVQLTLPQIKGENMTRHYEEVFPFNRMYTIHIRRTEDNHTFEQVEKAEIFHINGLVSGKEYCVRVQPSISSRGNVGERSSEICIYLPEQEVANSTLLVVAACILTVVVLLIFANFFICLYVREVVKTPKTLKSLIRRSWSWMDKPSSPIIETTLCWENALIDHLMTEHRNSVMRSSADSGFGSRIFDNSESQTPPVSLETSSDESDISVPRADSDFKEFSIKENIPEVRQQLQEEDSGISLSVDSPSLKRTMNCTDTPYRENVQSCGNDSGEILKNVRLAYLRQSTPETKSSSSEEQEVKNTCQPLIKDYISQGPQNPQKDHIEIQHHQECEDFKEPWTQISGVFQSSIPLTVAFSPFSRGLWNFGVSSPSLGDVELMDTRS